MKLSGSLCTATSVCMMHSTLRLSRKLKIPKGDVSVDSADAKLLLCMFYGAPQEMNSRNELVAVPVKWHRLCPIPCSLLSGKGAFLQL